MHQRQRKYLLVYKCVKTLLKLLCCLWLLYLRGHLFNVLFIAANTYLDKEADNAPTPWKTDAFGKCTWWHNYSGIYYVLIHLKNLEHCQSTSDRWHNAIIIKSSSSKILNFQKKRYNNIFQHEGRHNVHLSLPWYAVSVAFLFWSASSSSCFFFLELEKQTLSSQIVWAEVAEVSENTVAEI